jgi:UDP-N-acetylmuramoyl-L-alanyl-D-glutamate--2,6-diaminopimelate ligase
MLPARELRDLLRDVPGARVIAGNASGSVRQVRDDSRLVEAGDLFVAVPGTKSDGRRFVADALAKGATAVVSENEPAPDERQAIAARGGAWIVVPSARHALGVIASAHFGAAAGLALTGITGTNGKTTTTYLLEAIFAAAGRRPGIVGTVSYRYAGKEIAAPLTTPGALALHELFAAMRAAGCTDSVMEVSSIALDQGRAAGCRFRVAALTNVTQDHLDYHGTMDRYFAAKTILFRELLTPDGVAVLFTDREDGRRMRPEVRGRVLTVSTSGADGADVRVVERRLDGDGIRASFDTPVGRLEIVSALVGDYNLANLALAVGVAIGHGIARDAIATGLAAQRGVPGRLERVANDAGVLCVVDYAHTPDALERAMAAIRPLTKGRLIVVFGCGGDRDAGKRPIMGEAAGRQADLAIVTSDNPRTEDARTILDMIVAGTRRSGTPERAVAELAASERGYHVEIDRRIAIQRAIAAARPGDAILLAGKGHEDYQILGTQKIHFDDREEAAAAFRAGRAGGTP